MNRPPGFNQDFNGFNSATSELLLPPWERRDRFGFLNGLYLTIKDVLLSPGPFFQRMPSQMGLAQPLFFAITLGVAATFFGWMWSLAGSSLQLLVADNLGDVLRGPWWAFVLFLFSPIIISVGIFIKAAMIHIVLILLGGNKLGFEATFRVSAYSEAAGILALLPVCGSVIGVIWGLVIVIIGLFSIHETDPWKAVVAVILPMIIALSAISGSVVALVAGLT
ncbi:MAG: YIP1 family protein [Gemmatimonadales bacterium]|nr:YIP1 family protein [Gemmatimonadales bacterium]